MTAGARTGYRVAGNDIPIKYKRTYDKTMIAGISRTIGTYQILARIRSSSKDLLAVRSRPGRCPLGKPASVPLSPGRTP